MERGVAINYYNLVETRLKNIILDQVYLESLYKDMALLELEYAISGISYDGIGGSSGTSDSTGELAIRLADRRSDLELKIAKKFKEIQHVEVALNNLADDERNILNKHYLCNKNLITIAIETQWSLASVKRRKREAMQKMIRQLYGK